MSTWCDRSCAPARRPSAHLNYLGAAEITTFVVAEAPKRCIGSAKLMVTALRSFLRFLHVQGVLPESLVSAVPVVAGARLAGLPKGLAAGQVQQLLASCDRRTAVGRRDFAVLTMLVRLGLRPARSSPWSSVISTGATESSWCAAKALGVNASPCPSMLDWPWWTTCAPAVPPAMAGGCFYGHALHIAR